MNTSIRKVAIALAVLFAALFVNLNFVQVVKGDDYRDHPDNQRVLLDEHSSPRGDIIVAGTAIAHSIKTDDDQKYLRVYANGPTYAPVTGFYSLDAPTSSYLGTTGIEAAENSVLSGDDPRLFSTRLTDLLTGRNPRGGSVELTLDRATQLTAYRQLARVVNGRPLRGAVVALDPTTGAVLAAVSTPSYDPNKLSSHNSAAVRAAYRAYCGPPDAVGNCTNPSAPLLNRAFNQIYPPGSTFKVVVAATALKNGVTPGTHLIAPRSYYPETGDTKTTACTPGDTSCVQNFDGEECLPGSSTASLAYAFAKSCNTLFAAYAVDNSAGQKIADEAKLFGFDPDEQLTIPLPVADSTVGSHADLVENGFLARTAFGQQDVRMTPLQGAMIASAVANNGILMKPYLVSRELAPDLDELSKTQPTQLSQVLDPEPNQALQSMMEGVVQTPEGTGHAAAIPGAVVGGKTGTADTGAKLANGQDAPPDSWFIGYAMVNGQAKIAVAVLVEDGGNSTSETTGGATAAPIAQQVMSAFLKGHGGP
jgi:penicillin-binding protein A